MDPIVTDAPWSHWLSWNDVGPDGPDMLLTPDSAAMARIARHLGVERIDRLVATIHARRWLDGVAIAGRVEAGVTRLCGITLEPFEEHVDEPFEWRVVPDGSPNAPVAADGEIRIDLEADDPPDVVAGEAIDVGDHIVEHLALSLDPFPRKPEAIFEPPPELDNPSPFSVLARLDVRRRQSPSGD